MKNPTLALFLILMFITQNSLGQTLSEYQWKNRILFLIDYKLYSNEIAFQLKKFETHKEALLEREIIIFLVGKNQVYNTHNEKVSLDYEEICKNIIESSDFKGVILIGKDGGVKLKEKYTIEPKTIFDLIDGLPMRKSEMRKKQ